MTKQCHIPEPHWMHSWCDMCCEGSEAESYFCPGLPDEDSA